MSEQLAAIDLNFHDLRRKSGSQFFEHGMAPHYVQAFLDHANLSTTSRYLKITSQGVHAALKRVEQSRAHNPAERPTTGDITVKKVAHRRDHAEGEAKGGQEAEARWLA